MKPLYIITEREYSLTEHAPIEFSATTRYIVLL